MYMVGDQIGEIAIYNKTPYLYLNCPVDGNLPLRSNSLYTPTKRFFPFLYYEETVYSYEVGQSNDF